MVLARMTWKEVAEASREAVVVIPTGSLEQHGPHLPLFTDTILVTAVAEAVERELGDRALLTPALWLGASGHHLAFPGTLSASFEAYGAAVESVVESLAPHGFRKFFVLNGHGGNAEPNGVALRRLKARHPNLTLGHGGYFAFAGAVMGEVLEGPLKEIRHACEGEASLMLHLAPELVRTALSRDDGLYPVPPLTGVVHTFDEVTEEGSFGYATLASAEKGRRLFEACVAGAVANLRALADGYHLEARPQS
jgi:creatinine amidohydrolase